MSKTAKLTKTTPATVALMEAGVVFSLASYEYDPTAERVGLQAAEAMGVDPGMVFKTLMVLADGKPVCAVIPSDEEVNMKKLASAVGARSAQMMKPDDAERLTGFKVGGISPFGQKKPVKTVFEETALLFEAIYLNGGQRGLQILIDPVQALAASSGQSADIVR